MAKVYETTFNNLNRAQVVRLDEIQYLFQYQGKILITHNYAFSIAPSTTIIKPIPEQAMAPKFHAIAD